MTPPAPIRLAHLLDGRHFGGAEQIVRRLIETAPAIGVESWAYCLAEGRLTDFLRSQNLRVRVFPASSKFDFRVLPAIAAAARADGIQILQAHTSRTHLMARLLSVRLGIPNITTIHSPIAQDENRGVGLHPLRAWVERLGRPWTHQLVTVSQEEAERLAREEGVAREKISWIPNGAYPPPPERRAAARRALADFLAARGRDPEAFKIAMIAQLRPRKGPEVLIRAFAQLLAHGAPDSDLLLIGDDEFTGGGYLGALQALARDLGVAGAVHFTGFMADPWSLAAGADLIALPSLFGEGMPLVLLEAMSHGIPLAVSDTLGNRELARAGTHGWIHPPGDAAALAAQLAEAARDPAARHARGAAALQYFTERHTMERVQAQYRALYDTLLARAAAR